MHGDQRSQVQTYLWEVNFGRWNGIRLVLYSRWTPGKQNENCAEVMRLSEVVARSKSTPTPVVDRSRCEISWTFDMLVTCSGALVFKTRFTIPETVHLQETSA